MMNLSRRGIFGFLGGAGAAAVVGKTPAVALPAKPSPVNMTPPYENYVAISTTSVLPPSPYVPLWDKARIIPNPD